MQKKILSHFDESGAALMVDTGAKAVSARYACAEGVITMKQETLELVKSGGAKKGDVLGAARLAGIMAAKQTPQLIPLAHPLALESCAVNLTIEDSDAAARSDVSARIGKIRARCTVTLSGKTGAEMEALTGAAIALLTIYDMCKAVDRGMEIGNVRLLEKSGGKSGVYKRAGDAA
jgi:cyclic pyranopterin phosphate synthase